MHSIVRLYIKTAVAFLVVGLLLGGYFLARRELFGVMATPYEVSAHTHVILVGFVMTMILGVAGWIPWIVVASGFAQIAALLVFFYTMWSRIRGIGSQIREGRGEKF